MPLYPPTSSSQATGPFGNDADEVGQATLTGTKTMSENTLVAGPANINGRLNLTGRLRVI